MSSKKARRAERRLLKRQERTRGKSHTATLFMVGVLLTLVVLVAAALLLGDRSGPGEPPWPGAVWSAAHNHWH